MDTHIDIKTQRIKGFFLDAAKQIILREGVEGVSTRKIAEIAGYSYATIYHYFKDIDDLLGETKFLMISDMMVYMQEDANFSVRSVADLKELFRHYIQYYLEYPTVFGFFYFYKLPHDNEIQEHFHFDSLWTGTLHFLVEEQIIKEDEIRDCAITLIYAVHGVLTLFLSGNGPNAKELFNDVDRIIEFTLRSI